MKLGDARRRIEAWDEKGRWVWTTSDLAHVFPDASNGAVRSTLLRLVNAGVARRACRGVYVTNGAASADAWLLDHVAAVLRRGHPTYLSLEAALHEHGAISQVPTVRTFMTTGRRGWIPVGAGVVEFVHTKQSAESIARRTIDSTPLRRATLETAWEDLQRVGRNLSMVDMDEARELARWEAEAFGDVVEATPTKRAERSPERASGGLPGEGMAPKPVDNSRG